MFLDLEFAQIFIFINQNKFAYWALKQSNAGV